MVSKSGKKDSVTTNNTLSVCMIRISRITFWTSADPQTFHNHIAHSTDLSQPKLLTLFQLHFGNLFWLIFQLTDTWFNCARWIGKIPDVVLLMLYRLAQCTGLISKNNCEDVGEEGRFIRHNSPRLVLGWGLVLGNSIERRPKQGLCRLLLRFFQNGDKFWGRDIVIMATIYP